MKYKSIICLLLLATAAAMVSGSEADWSWKAEGKEASDSTVTFPEDSSSRDGHSLDAIPHQPNTDSLALYDDSIILSHDVLPLATEGESLPFPSEPLPLEPHGTATFSVVGEGDIVDGIVVADSAGDVDSIVLVEGGDREGRFLGLGDKLCSFGIGVNCAKKYPTPVKSHYAPPKVSNQKGFYGPPPTVKPHYGAPLSRPPPPPYIPNRNYKVPTTTAAPFSPLNGILSVLKPFMPTSKPKVSKVGVLSPSYTAPNPNYAPLLPSYVPPAKAPAPSYAPPVSVYSPPQQPAYVAPRPPYVASRPSYVAQRPSYVAPKPSYVAPVAHTVHTKPAYIHHKVSAPTPSYVAQPAHVKPSYATPKLSYAQSKPVYVNPVPTVTVHAKPTLVEQHHHTHTHIYNDEDTHHDIYKDDHNGVLQSVHSSINQDIIYRQDISKVSSHDDSHNIVQVAQPSINNPVVAQQQIPVASPTPSIVPAVLVGGTNFRPGRSETGFQPIAPALETLFRPQQRIYDEDCQCVPSNFCSFEDVIARNAPADLSHMIDARNRGSDILSTASESNDETIQTNSNDEAVQTSARRGKHLRLDETLDVTESETSAETTEAVTELVTENWVDFEETTEPQTEAPELTEAPESIEAPESTELPIRSRRDVNETSEESQDEEAIYPDRQGRQLTGFTSNGKGCGVNHVCCRRPVFKPKTQRFACGRRNANGLLGRVKTANFVQGDTEFGAYPWQAAILKREDGDILYQCGATLIDDRHILTAAHCVDGLHPSEVQIRLGEWDVSGQTEFYQHIEMRASGIYIHPEFYAGNLNNDIAVVRLEHFVDLSSNPHITPVCLPDKFADFTHQRCHATGWGKDAFGNEGKFSHILQEVEMPVLDHQSCQTALQRTRLGASFSLHAGNFCAGGEAGRDTCKGDGGGPLVCSGPEGSMQLAGLVSWGIGCGNNGVPGVYVKVPHYVDWIKDITKS